MVATEVFGVGVMMAVRRDNRDKIRGSDRNNSRNSNISGNSSSRGVCSLHLKTPRLMNSIRCYSISY